MQTILIFPSCLYVELETKREHETILFNWKCHSYGTHHLRFSEYSTHLLQYKKNEWKIKEKLKTAFESGKNISSNEKMSSTRHKDNPNINTKKTTPYFSCLYPAWGIFHIKRDDERWRLDF